MKIAYFITAHGFGHASRASAVMEALLQRRPDIQFELFTTCPQQIFKDSIETDFGYHPVQSDIGIVQLSPLKENISATCDQLDRFLPFEPRGVKKLATQLTRLNCRIVICDISPLGIHVAKRAGLPSVLIENFTWDWIYDHYPSHKNRLAGHIAYLAELIEQVDLHIQTPPLCKPTNKATKVAPISRKTRSNRSVVRSRLGIEPTEPMVLLTMGGVPDRFDFLSKLPQNLEAHIVIPGADGLRTPHPKVTLLPTHGSIYHPDLIAAADVLISKAGYSTIAEAYQCGIPFGYIRRPRSPESAALEAFIKDHLPSLSISEQAYDSGRWIELLPELLCMARSPLPAKNGADEVAQHISTLLPIRDNCDYCVAAESSP